MTEGELEIMLDMEGKRDSVYDDSGVWMGFREVRNNRRIEAMMVYRTMTMCDLAWEDGTPLFDSKDNRVRHAMTEQAFRKNWELIPPDYASKIIEKFRDHNPGE